MSPRIIPAITLHQPYACLIEIGVKIYETRPMRAPAKMVGARIAIHAAARPCRTDMSDESYDAITEAFGFCGWNYRLPRGVVVCTAFLDSCVRTDTVTPDPFGDYSPGRWAWRLTRVVPLVPHLPARGQRRYGWPFTLPDSAWTIEIPEEA